MRSSSSKVANWPIKILSLFFVVMVFEGAIRKWVAPQLGTLLQIFRDGLPTIALLSYFSTRPKFADVRWVLSGASLKISFLVYLFFAILTMSISGLESIAIALLGLRTHFAYAPLAFLVPLLFPEAKTMIRVFTFAAALALPVCLVAVYQTTQPPESFINIYASGEEANAAFGLESLIRASGTFSYITGMGYFSQFTFVSGLFLYFSADNRFQKRIGFLAGLLGLMAAFSSGSRAVVYGGLFQISIMAIICPELVKRFFRKIVSNIMIFGVAFVAVSYFAVSQITAFFQRAESAAGDEGGRLALSMFEWVGVVIANPLGSGLGAGHQKAATLIGGVGGFGPIPEAELSRVAYEMGLIGFVTFLFFRYVVLTLTLSVSLRAFEFQTKLLAAMALSYIALLLTGGVYTPVANALFWFFLGVILMVRKQAKPTSMGTLLSRNLR